ncbi:MAG: Hsp70 family protein, partial [Gammaproteobacteria bacterium]
MGKIIGIDLGTTMSAMAVVDEMGRPVMIPNREGKTLTPSAVLIRGEERVVGDTAKRAAVARPQNVFQFIKRRLCDPGFVFIDENEQEHRPEELSALILKKLKQDAEQSLGTEVTEAVITVPAYFADLERNRTRQAGEIAGIKVLDIINEPTAAAIAYGLGKAEANKIILVYDLGGGTFDVTIIKVVGPEELQVLTSGGDRFLGGADFDADLSDYYVQQFERKHSVDLKKIGDLKTDQDFRNKAELAKIDLSADTQVDVSLSAAGKVLDLTLKRTEFETLIKHRIENTRGLTEEALQAAKLDWPHIDKVLLVGGSTRIPRVQQIVKELFGKDPHRGVNPDEVVAVGAAIQAGVLAGEVKDLLLLDVTPLSLGIETLGGVMTTLIPRNTTIPTRKSETFSTAADNQTSVEVHVLQGERPMARDNRTLGKFHLVGIPPAPRGVPQVEVTFDIDANGILNVSAQD